MSKNSGCAFDSFHYVNCDIQDPALSLADNPPPEAFIWDLLTRSMEELNTVDISVSAIAGTLFIDDKVVSKALGLIIEGGLLKGITNVVYMINPDYVWCGDSLAAHKRAIKIYKDLA